MSQNQNIAIEMLDEIDRARSGSLPLDQLEYKLWRLLDAVGMDFPKSVAGRVENLVLEIQELQRENVNGAGGSAVDENRGVDDLYNEVTGEISRFIR